jgi:hypothetical protein
MGRDSGSRLRGQSGRRPTGGCFFADPATIVGPGLTILGRGADHLVEEVGGMQGHVDMLLDAP